MLVAELSYKEFFLRLKANYTRRKLAPSRKNEEPQKQSYLVNTHKAFHLFYIHLITLSRNDNIVLWGLLYM